MTRFSRTSISSNATSVAATYSATESLAGMPSSVATASGRTHATNRSANALNAMATAWFVVAIIGQLLFVAYVVGFYGGAAVQGQLEKWNDVAVHAHVAGDLFGNGVMALHLAFAVVIILGGALQLTPAVRRRWPVFHRWNGRLYLLSALILSLGGIFTVWTRGGAGDHSLHIAISINALVIIGCAGMALFHALARRFDLHRRWALRLFLSVSGVWFFRIGLMFWLIVNQGPVGFDPETFSGPFLTFLGFAQYVLPLTVLELYFRARDNAGPRGRWAMAIGLGALTLVTMTGIAAASMMMWLPRL